MQWQASLKLVVSKVKNDNFKTGGSEQSMESTVDEGEISITNESDTISTGGEEGIEQEAVVESETGGGKAKERKHLQ